ncbi:uncharacterized protein LOC142612587 isoform X2 [Castanea sativa]|uniref:uncharacterized protein LOC142612587 isoform X2 n=1 Tax=Castanea sativa TaxID=21020 RepID=UPI003F64F0F4
MAITTLFYPPKFSFPHRPTRQVSSSTPHSKTQTQVQTRTRNSINHGTIQNPKTTMAAALLGAGLTLTLVGPTSAAELPSLLLLGSTSLQLSEPTNALSLPTWAIHVSSVVEWITAMALVWQYGEQSGYESWKGLSWDMVLSSTQQGLHLITWAELNLGTPSWWSILCMHLAFLL